jgi:hypothetical protein
MFEADNGDQKMGNPMMNELIRAASFLNPGHVPGIRSDDSYDNE